MTTDKATSQPRLWPGKVPNCDSTAMHGASLRVVQYLTCNCVHIQTCHAAVCAVIGTKTDAELRETFATLDKVDIGLFQNSKTVDLMTHAIKKGHLQVCGQPLGSQAARRPY